MAITNKLRFEVFKRDNFLCAYCGKHPPEVILEVDHIISKKEGGKDNIENLITACFECNRGKGSISLDSIPNTLQEKIKKQKESLKQLKAFYKYQERNYQEKEKDVEKLNDIWTNLSPNKSWDFTETGKIQLKNLLNRFTFYDIKEAMEIASIKIDDGEKRFKYMCGILWTKRKRREI